MKARGRYGKFRCGRCGVVLKDLNARQALQGHELRERRKIAQRDPGRSWSHDEIQAVLSLNNRRGRHLAMTGDVVIRDQVAWLVLHCKRCHVDYGLPVNDLHRRQGEAQARREDVILTDLDILRNAR